MQKFIRGALPTALVLMLVACASPKPGTPEFVAVKEVEQQKAAVQAQVDYVKKIPDWVRQPPMDAKALYVSGQGRSENQQLSMRLALLDARTALANQLSNQTTDVMNQLLSGSNTGNTGGVQEAIDQAVKSTAVLIDLSGYVMEKSELFADGPYVRTFVLLRYPKDAHNRVVVDQIKKSSVLAAKFKDSKAWQDLEREIELAKKK
jgi:hypothetical protein